MSNNPNPTHLYLVWNNFHKSTFSIFILNFPHSFLYSLCLPHQASPSHSSPLPSVSALCTCNLHLSWWDQISQAHVLRLVYPDPCHQAQLCCASHGRCRVLFSGCCSYSRGGSAGGVRGTGTFSMFLYLQIFISSNSPLFTSV